MDEKTQDYAPTRLPDTIITNQDGSKTVYRGWVKRRKPGERLFGKSPVSVTFLQDLIDEKKK